MVLPKASFGVGKFGVMNGFDSSKFILEGNSSNGELKSSKFFEFP